MLVRLVTAFSVTLRHPATLRGVFYTVLYIYYYTGPSCNFLNIKSLVLSLKGIA